jgi:hypothetical protein
VASGMSMNIKKMKLLIVLAMLCACTNMDRIGDSTSFTSKAAGDIFGALNCNREEAIKIAANAVKQRAPDEYRKVKKAGFNVCQKMTLYIGDEITEKVILESRYLSKKVEKTILNGTVYYEEGIWVGLSKDCSVLDVRPYKGKFRRRD